jgi:DNA-binding SARP family transcriptional activator
MELKDIALTSGSRHYHWPLDETMGETGSERSGAHPARVKNPNWLKPKYQHWELAGSFPVNGYAGTAYNPKQDKLYITGSDSIAVYTFTKDGLTTEWIPTRHIEFLVGHQNIYDTLTNHLLDVFIDRKTVSTFNPVTRQWDQNFTYGPLTEYWHANKFLSPGDSSLYIVGGYGQLRYKNLVQRYHFPTRRWDSIKTTGDYLPPHYLAALGADEKFAYILGGYGSHTGDQMLDPRNYYDLFRFDIKHRSFKRLLTLKTPAFPYTLANSLILAPGGNWYGLIFSNDSYNSQLQLIKGSLSDSTYQPVATPIPYNFYDIQSFADLYYSPISNKLIAVTLHYSKYTSDNQKDKNTQVRIYTLNYPPEPAGPATATLTITPARRITWLPIIGIAFLLFIVLALIALRRRARRKAAKNRSVAPDTSASSTTVPILAVAGTITEEEVSQPIAASSLPSASIFLFGSFQTLDREGHDCTRLFTPLLKELFLLITTYTIRNGRGISSEGLNEILWHDKSEKDAKNNRSVNLAKLKLILEKIGACTIAKEAGYWQLQTGDDIFLDYKHFSALLQDNTPPDIHNIHALIDIVKRGPFLLQTEYNWLDDIKSAVSNAVIDRCLHYLRLHSATENPEFAIEIANCIFFFDQLNEDALTVKCKSLIHLKRHNLASNTYLKFAKDYKDIYNAEFSRSFQQIIA